MLMEKLQQPPEIRMEDGVAAGQIKIRETSIHLTEIKAVIERVLHLLPGHGIQLAAGITGKDIAMLTALVAFIRDMPLEGKELLHQIHL